MHTDDTLRIFNEVTVNIGQQFCTFINTMCPAFDTRELNREVNAHKHWDTKRPGTAASTTTTWQQKMFNLETYKHHALGDYGATIEMYGICDSYTTELVSNYHLNRLS